MTVFPRNPSELQSHHSNIKPFPSPPTLSTQGHAGRALWCLPGPGRGALPVQPVGPGVEAGRGCRPGRLQLIGTGQHRPLDRPRRRRVRRRHQGVPGPVPRHTAIQPLQPQTVKGDWERSAKGGRVWFRRQFSRCLAMYHSGVCSVFVGDGKACRWTEICDGAISERRFSFVFSVDVHSHAFPSAVRYSELSHRSTSVTAAWADRPTAWTPMAAYHRRCIYHWLTLF